MTAIPPASPQEAGRAEQERKARVLVTIAFFIIGLSIVLSYDWGAPAPQFRSDAGLTILLGILVAAIIYIASRYTTKGAGPFGLGLRFCPACGRRIPFDARLCPYCGQRLP
jgi:hypothetical protein